LNKKFLKHYMETNPEGTAQTYIFLVDNQDIALNIVMSGYQALCLVQEDDGYYFSVDSFIEEMRSIQFTGSCQSAYHYVAACTVKWMNDKLQTFFKDAGLDGKAGWQLFKEKEYLGKLDNQKEVEKLLEQYILRFERDPKEEPELSRFHLFDAKGNVKGVRDMEIVDYLVENVQFFVVGITPYYYEHGAFLEDHDGVRMKYRIQKLIYRDQVQSGVIKRIYNLLITQPKVYREAYELNKQPVRWINFKNGYYDPVTGEMLEHNPDYLTINQIPFPYYPEDREQVLHGGENIKKYLASSLPNKEEQQTFYNISKYTFDSLLADPENIEANFRDYLNGFSANVQDVLSKFDFDNIIRRMVESNTLYLVIKEFNSQKGYLGPDKISAVDCGYIFEDLVKRFSESFGEEAGAHFTSRDIIYLMTDLLLSDADLSKGGNVTVYDMAMGTSQMLSCMEERIQELNTEIGVTCFGQEFNPSTFAIAKADMMIRGGDPNNMRFGDTLSEDQFSGYQFQYIISNPPFGIDWKREKAAVEAEAKKGDLGRFAPGLPKISDGQQLFVLNGLSKLAPNGKMAIIQNGSPLFSGDAGSGPSEIRRYILENDWLDAIVQLGTDMFMNTGISTYIWICSKDKPLHRTGKVQLIDASHCYEARRKSIGTKRNDITDQCRDLIVTNPMVEVFKNRIEFSNAGAPLVAIERIVDSVPVSRNENIAGFMHKCGICEERGSGYDKIVEATGKNELLAPRIENQNNQFTKAILFAKVPFELTTKEDRMRTCYMQACLAYVNFEGISNSDIRKIFGLGEKEKAKASRLLTSAVEGGYIKVMDPDTAPRYKKYIPYWA